MGGLGMVGMYGGPQSVFRFCEGSARSLYEPLDFPVSVIFLQSSYAANSRQNFLTTVSPFPRARDGYFCQSVYLCANSSALVERSNPPQTWPEASGHLR